MSTVLIAGGAGFLGRHLAADLASRGHRLAIARATLGLSDDVDLPPGVVIAASPNPVRNSDLMAAFRAHTGRRFGLATPAALLRIGAVALRTALAALGPAR